MCWHAKQAKVIERKFPSESSQANVPKRNVPSERSQTKVIERTKRVLVWVIRQPQIYIIWAHGVELDGVRHAQGGARLWSGRGWGGGGGVWLTLKMDAKLTQKEHRNDSRNDTEIEDKTTSETSPKMILKPVQKWHQNRYQNGTWKIHIFQAWKIWKMKKTVNPF